MHTDSHGYIALSLVILITAVVIALSTTVALLSVGEVQSGLALAKGEDSLNLVEGCAEDALLYARASATYTGGNLTRPEGTCTISINKAGSTWTFTVSTLNTAYKRTIQMVTTYSGYGVTLNTGGWSEI